MKNPMLFYTAIALGAVILVVSLIFLLGGHSAHHVRWYAGIALGIVLLIAGLVGAFVLKPKAV